MPELRPEPGDSQVMNYEPPKIEHIITAQQLSREALYAGSISKGPG